MGCLNSTGAFSHWFGNIHLSGPCNRSCYFCIGQHMMSLDPLNVLNKWPLDGLDEFVEACREKGVREINLTGTNTDPMLFRSIPALYHYLAIRIEGLVFGVRTNGANVLSRPLVWKLFDKASISITSFDRDIYRATMGNGEPPDVRAIIALDTAKNIKANIVLCPELGNDLFDTIDTLAHMGIRRINLREPYGQPRIGDPMERAGYTAIHRTLGMPTYGWVRGVTVTYWDVHYCEVESVNLYASGRVSIDYPITRGHDPSGTVQGQEHFHASGRIRPQWITVGGRDTTAWADRGATFTEEQ